MAYRDPTFNANLFTDLLSTYLENQSSEREKYFKAEQTLSKPQYKTSGGNIIKIDPRTGETTTIYEAPKEKKEPKFEDFPQMDKDGNPTGMTIKGQFTGTNESFVGVPLGYEPVGKKAQFKPEDPKKRDIQIEDKDIALLVSEAKRLRKLRDKDYTTNEMLFMEAGMAAPSFTTENQQQLDFYEAELAKRGFTVFGQKIEDAKGGESGGENNNPTLPKKGSFFD